MRKSIIYDNVYNAKKHYMNVVILRSLVAILKWQAHLNLVYIHSSAAGALLKARPVDCYEQIESKNVQELHQRRITRKEPALLLRQLLRTPGVCVSYITQNAAILQ